MLIAAAACVQSKLQHYYPKHSKIILTFPINFQAYRTFEKLRVQMNLPGTHPVPSPRALNNDEHHIANEFDKHQKYPLEMLRGDPFNLPTYINPTRKEVN